MERKIQIHRMNNSSACLSLLDSDADGEFMCCVQQNDEDIYAVISKETVVGLALAAPAEDAYLYLYIFPQYRQGGFGTAAVTLLEKLLQEKGAQRIQTCYRSDNSAAHRFTERVGYHARFASSYMTYGGKGWTLPDLPIRSYQSRDFEEAHAMCADAFHQMRLQTGWFPDSKPEQPDNETRSYWDNTADRRFVYTQGSEIVGTLLLEGNEIGAVAMKQACQGNGIGTMLVQFAVNRLLSDGCKEVALYCVVGNPARHLYDKLGFCEQYRNTYAEKKL